ncbi:MAG: hypothetical protein KDE15_11990 [Erythrobacter sp.]|nr:hypothetical protein [Erythrobacter sp.]
MTQLLALLTAYGAVAIAAWLAVLLYPHRIPAADSRRLPDRWRWTGGYLLALLAAVGLGMLEARDWLFAADTTPGTMANRLLIYAPLLAFVFWRRSLAAALLPRRDVLASLAIGLAFAVLALAAWFSVIGPQQFPAFAASITQANTVAVALRAALFDIALGTWLALLADGWSRRVALAVTSLATFAAHIAFSLAGGIDSGELLSALTAGAIALGLFSAVLATRNVLWFFPVHLALSLALAQAG